MKILCLPFHRLTVATLAGIGFAGFFIPQSSLAQMVNDYDQQSFDQQNNDVCSGGNGQSFNMFNLIHCANLRNRGWDSSDQNQDINAAAREFREIQRKRFEQQQQGQQPQTQPTTKLPVFRLQPTTPQQSQ